MKMSSIRTVGPSTCIVLGLPENKGTSALTVASGCDGRHPRGLTICFKTYWFLRKESGETERGVDLRSDDEGDGHLCCCPCHALGVDCVAAGLAVSSEAPGFF